MIMDQQSKILDRFDNFQQSILLLSSKLNNMENNYEEMKITQNQMQMTATRQQIAQDVLKSSNQE